MNIRGAKPHQTWAQWENELHQEILKLWNTEHTVKEIAFFLQLSQPYVMNVLNANERTQKVFKPSEPIAPAPDPVNYPLPPAKVQAYADQNGQP